MRIHEKHVLQAVVALGCLVPLSAGLSGVLLGVDLLGGGNPFLDNHFRYLSGLLLGIGLGFLSAVPRIEYHTARFRLLTAIVVIGGAGRLIGILENGIPNRAMGAALLMELAVTPLLCLWQHRVATTRLHPRK